MPSVVNGIGTWYWGKSKIHHTADFCEHCGAYGHLLSYNTTTYFVIFFVPLIPMGKRRIVDQCPSCQKHNVIKWKAWERIRNEELLPSIETFLTNPSDSESAKKAAANSILLDDEESFLAVASVAEESLAQDGEVQGLIGHGYWRFGMVDAAGEAFERAMNTSGEQHLVEGLARVRMHQGRPGEAEPLMGHILADKDEQRAALLYLLAQAYQANRQHQEAIDVVNQVEEAMPTVASNKLWSKLKKVSERRLETGYAVKHAHLSSPRIANQKGDRGKEMLPRLVGPIILALLVIGFSIASISTSKARQLWVVNGLPREYQVDIDGRVYKLPPQREISIRVPEGEIDWKVVNDEHLKASGKYEIKSSFIGRLFDGTTYVLNPDETALLYWQEVVYSTNPVGNDPHVKIHVGKAEQLFTRIDAEFEPLPNEVSISSSSSTATRRQIKVLSGHDFWTTYSAVLQYNNRAAAEELTRDCLRAGVYEADCLDALQAMSQYTQADVDLLKTRIDRRPVEVVWHRLYQQAMQSVAPDHDLKAEYAQYVKDEPDNANLKYLYARMIDDPVEQMKLFQEAANATSPSAWAHYAIYMQGMRTANWDHAMDHAATASELEPDSELFANSLYTAYVAKRDYANVLRFFVLPSLESAPDGYEHKARHIQFLAAQGRNDKAKTAAEEFAVRVSKNAQYSDADKQQVASLVWASYHYAVGDNEAFAKALSETGSPHYQFQAAFTTGDLGSASNLLSQRDQQYSYMDWTNHALMYIAHHRKGESQRADHYFNSMLKAIETHGNEEEKKFALIFKRRSIPRAADLQSLWLDPVHFRFAAAVLATRYPMQADTFGALVKEYNYWPGWPSNFLEQVATK